MKYAISLRPARIVVYSFFLFLGVFVLGSCRMPFDWSLDVRADSNMTAPQAITVTGDHFTLYWDSPAVAADAYRIYQRPHGSTGWSLLFDGLPSPQATVTTAELPYGAYEFAVSSVNEYGAESELHTCLDSTADPGTGWYLCWTEG